MKQWLRIWDVQDIHHQPIVSVSIRSTCHYTKHYQSQGLSALKNDELGWAADFIISWWCFTSMLTCACIGVMHIWALYWNLGTYGVVPVHISHKVCIIRFSSGWWSGMRSNSSTTDDVIWPCCPQSAATIRSKCQHIKHTVVLALIFCTSQKHLDLGQEATLCSLVAGKDGKDHQQQGITVELFSLGKDHQWTSITSSQHARDYLWVAPMCTTSKPFNKRITA